MPASSSSSFRAAALAWTVARSSSPRVIGTITTCQGASLGGSRRPVSSPWAITTAPTMRVLRPQEVVQHNFCSLFSSRKRMSKAWAKFCPRLWLVPACRARLSPIMASIV